MVGGGGEVRAGAAGRDRNMRKLMKPEKSDGRADNTHSTQPVTPQRPRGEQSPGRNAPAAFYARFCAGERQRETHSGRIERHHERLLHLRFQLRLKESEPDSPACTYTREPLWREQNKAGGVLSMIPQRVQNTPHDTLLYIYTHIYISLIIMDMLLQINCTGAHKYDNTQEMKQ